MIDPWKNASGDAQSFGRRGYVVTPGASDLATVSKGLFVIADGDVTFIPADNADDETLTVSVVAGAVVPYLVRRVTAATATVATIEG